MSYLVSCLVMICMKEGADGEVRSFWETATEDGSSTCCVGPTRSEGTERAGDDPSTAEPTSTPRSQSSAERLASNKGRRLLAGVVVLLLISVAFAVTTREVQPTTESRCIASFGTTEGISVLTSRNVQDRTTSCGIGT